MGLFKNAKKFPYFAFPALLCPAFDVCPGNLVLSLTQISLTSVFPATTTLPTLHEPQHLSVARANSNQLEAHALQRNFIAVFLAYYITIIKCSTIFRLNTTRSMPKKFIQVDRIRKSRCFYSSSPKSASTIQLSVPNFYTTNRTIELDH